MEAVPVAQVSQGAVLIVWWVSIIIALVVAIVVAILLEMVRRTALSILDGASQIWTQGQLVANNTIQIPLLLPVTNQVVGQILNTAAQIVGAANAIEQHAEGCPGCPDCVLGSKGGS
jgi:hypothetical protein